MSAGGTPQVDAANAIRSRLAGADSRQAPPGTLTKWADSAGNPYWEFVGNGETTATDFVHTAALREAEDGNAQVQPIAGHRPFAEAAASKLLDTDNPNAPIAKGDVKELSLKDLVSLISPFLATYAAGQAGAGGPGAGRPNPAGALSEDERARVATGQVSSQGLSLPID